MTARWIWITAVGAAAMLGACDKGRPPTAEAPAEQAPAPAPTPEPAPAPPPEADPAAPPAPAPSDPEPAADAGGAPADQPDPTAGGSGKKPPAGAKGKCGGVGGIQCKKGQKCVYDSRPAPPDAMGTCRPEKYCEAPPDCEGLMHIMVVGHWECVKNVCAWKSDGGASAPQ